MPSYRLAELASRFGAMLHGDGERTIAGVGTLQEAGPGQIAFLANPKYRRYLANTNAAAVILREADAVACPVPALLAADPYVLYARIATLFAPADAVEPGVSDSAWLDPTAQVDAGAQIAPGAVVQAGAIVAAGAYIGPNCTVGVQARIGAGSRLVANVSIGYAVELGERVLVHPGAVIGADGFGLANYQGRWLKVPQLGSVRIGDDCEIGANTTIDRGALGDTILEEGVKLDNQIQIAHNVHIGAHTAIAGCTGIAGSTRIGRACMIAGAVGITGHLEICDRVTITSMTLVTHSITEPGVYSGSLPMDNAQIWRKNSARYRQLDGMARRLAALEKKLSRKPNDE